MLDPYCDDCRERGGYRRVRVPDGRGGTYEALRECRHGESGVENRESGFKAIGEGIPKLIEGLNPIARAVREIIGEHRGENNPVTIAEIAAKVKRSDRDIKQAVADLILLGKMLIGSSRDAKPGYFLIESGEELNRQRAHCLHHLRAWAKRFKALDPDGSAAQELYGQLRAEFEQTEAR